MLLLLLMLLVDSDSVVRSWEEGVGEGIEGGEGTS